jgi:hypothetical protein
MTFSLSLVIKAEVFKVGSCQCKLRSAFSSECQGRAWMLHANVFASQVPRCAAVLSSLSLYNANHDSKHPRPLQVRNLLVHVFAVIHVPSKLYSRIKLSLRCYKQSLNPVIKPIHLRASRSNQTQWTAASHTSCARRCRRLSIPQVSYVLSVPNAL